MNDFPKPACIVLVEDNPGDIFLVREAINERAITAELLAFDNAPHARRYFMQAERPPSLLLLDINLIDANGLDLLEELRAMERYAQLRAAVLSSSVSLSDRERARALQVLRFIEKPATLDGFLAVVGGAIQELLPH